jgi:hypothetical protein
MTGTGTRLQPGNRIGGFEVLSVDPTGKRCCVSCQCARGVHIVGTQALLAGSVVCAALPLTPQQVRAARQEIEAAERRRELRDWRPGGK